MTRLLSLSLPFSKHYLRFTRHFLGSTISFPLFRKFPFQPFCFTFLLALLESWKKRIEWKTHRKPSNLFHCVGITGWSCVRAYMPFISIHTHTLSSNLNVCDIIKNDVKEIFILLITLMTHELRKIYCEILYFSFSYSYIFLRYFFACVTPP